MLIVLTMMVMIRSNLPEGIYHTAGLYLHALVFVRARVCAMLEVRNASILNVKKQQEEGRG
jgi:hypothetical protein